MDAKQVQLFKNMLLKMKQEDEVLLEQDEYFDTTELSTVETEHLGDIATDLVIQTTEMAIDEFREDKIEKIDEALQAIEMGTYGTCTECDQLISAERLEVVPTGLTYVEHIGQK